MSVGERWSAPAWTRGRHATRQLAPAYALVAPALAIVALFFVVPLGLSVVVAFQDKDGGFTLENFAKAYELYTHRPHVHDRRSSLLSSVLIARRSRSPSPAT